MRRRLPPPTPWQGALVAGFAIATLGVLIGVLTIDVATGRFHDAAWMLTVAGAVIGGVSIHHLTP